MARNSEHWERWNHYQTTGEWLPTQKQKDAARDRARAAEDEGHGARSVAQNEPKVEETHTEKVVREWWARHPHLR